MTAGRAPLLTGIVLVEEAIQYGLPVLRPSNELAKALCEFRQIKTFTPLMVSQLKAMGLRVLTNGVDPKEL